MGNKKRKKKWHRKRKQNDKYESKHRMSKKKQSTKKTGQPVLFCTVIHRVDIMPHKKETKQMWSSQGAVWQLPFCLAILFYFLLSKCLAQWYAERGQEEGEEVWLKTTWLHTYSGFTKANHSFCVVGVFWCWFNHFFSHLWRTGSVSAEIS